MISHIQLSRPKWSWLAAENARADLRRIITARGEISFKMFYVPQTIIEIMIVLHTDSLVFSSDVLGAHGGFPNG